jgi:hypothetical protein
MEMFLIFFGVFWRGRVTCVAESLVGDVTGIITSFPTVRTGTTLRRAFRITPLRNELSL